MAGRVPPVVQHHAAQSYCHQYGQPDNTLPQNVFSSHAPSPTSGYFHGSHQYQIAPVAPEFQSSGRPQPPNEEFFASGAYSDSIQADGAWAAGDANDRSSSSREAHRPCSPSYIHNLPPDQRQYFEKAAEGEHSFHRPPPSNPHWQSSSSLSQGMGSNNHSCASYHSSSTIFSYSPSAPNTFNTVNAYRVEESQTLAQPSKPEARPELISRLCFLLKNKMSESDWSQAAYILPAGTENVPQQDFEVFSKKANSVPTSAIVKVLLQWFDLSSVEQTKLQLNLFTEALGYVREDIVNLIKSGANSSDDISNTGYQTFLSQIPYTDSITRGSLLLKIKSTFSHKLVHDQIDTILILAWSKNIINDAELLELLEKKGVGDKSGPLVDYWFNRQARTMEQALDDLREALFVNVRHVELVSKFPRPKEITETTSTPSAQPPSLASRISSNDDNSSMSLVAESDENSEMPSTGEDTENSSPSVDTIDTDGKKKKSQ
ncbi:hypothetical protein D5018_13765 [Parashewanella curva]|uniref:Uncharacterized protein n=1 Tax=Parashewanella curva TaxID=2338552 RepID=A0A3L8PUY6_9GAMM|nr:hypothetical protein [Parashewanella curva]RLV59136.1 hypothetical protein D5018_13765 [Parashewanella curva]